VNLSPIEAVIISPSRVRKMACTAENTRMLDHLRGFAVILGFFFLGAFLSRIGVPLPGGVLGLLLFYLALTVGLIKLEWVERAAGLLLRHMVLLFIPLTVGLMEMGQVLARQSVAIVASLLVSWTAGIVTTGLLGRWLLPDEPEPVVALASGDAEAAR
jgi:holin-like protein